MKTIRQSMHDFEIASHRGLGFGDENTVEAILAAAAEDFVVEYDVHDTSDGVLVVVHDDQWDRTTDGTGAVAEIPYAEVEKFSIRTLRDTSGASIKVPRFTDILTGVGAQTIHIIEPKAKNIAGKIIDLVQEHGLLSNVRFNTDDLGVAREITAREPGAIVGFVTEDPTFTPDQVPNLAGAGVSYLSSWASLTPRPLVDACHANGLEVRPYFKGTQVLWTKGMRNEVLRLRDMGVDGVIVNHPQEVRRLVEMSTETIARIRPQLAA